MVDIAQNGLNWSNGLALAADVASVVIPGVTGAGALVRALTHVDDAVDAVKAVDRVGDVVDAVRTAENAGDAVQAANQANRVSDAANVVGDFCSFTADTPVATSAGQQSISQIDEGDQVLAYDESTGVTEYYTVTAVLEHVDLLEVRLTIQGEQITTTPEHPFYVEGYGWIPAGELWEGAEISQVHAGTGRVTQISIAFAPQRMYNLTVAQAHTFFVGQGQWLVHNACSGEFSIIDWSGYPDGPVPKPEGDTFRLLTDGEYDNARQLANSANDALHRSNPELHGLEIHEIVPVKFGGSPTDSSNKIALPHEIHSQYTTWWKRVQRRLEAD